MSSPKIKIAVVLFNLGGPDSLKAVQPFLFNLFNDPAIIDQPRAVRWLVATLVSKLRAPFSKRIYAQIGGSSPILSETEAQAYALEQALHAVIPAIEARVFPAMRYWHPLFSEVVQDIEEWYPDRIVLLPLYPQFSNVTTGSAFSEWRRVVTTSKRVRKIPTVAIRCWPTENSWIVTVAELTEMGLKEVQSIIKTYGNVDHIPRVLFSAHGLPKHVITCGDPYQFQVEKTVSAIVALLKRQDLDYVICYQSRIGFSKNWLGPSTGNALREAGADGVPVVLVPVTFVSEHVETLVELDIKYQNIAVSARVPVYVRVPTVRVHPRFISGLSTLIREALA